MTEVLPSCNDGPAKRAIVAFVERAVSDVPVAERLAVFDNDGSLWLRVAMAIP